MRVCAKLKMICMKQGESETNVALPTSGKDIENWYKHAPLCRLLGQTNGETDGRGVCSAI